MRLFFTYSANSDFPSRMIQSITNSRWTHCGIILDQELLGDPLVVDCAWDRGGVRLTFWSLLQHMPHEVFEIENISSELQTRMARGMMNIRYSYAKILLYPIKKYLGEAASNKCISFLNKLGLWNDPWEDGMWCSEFCYLYLSNVDVIKNIGLDSETITPEDLYQIALKSPQFKKVDR